MFRIFLLSPPNSAGLRAQALLGRRSRTEMAARLAGGGAPLGEVSAYLSSLYFRGKLAYATAFGRAPEGCSAQYVITPDRGLVCASTRITLDDLHAFSRVPIDLKEPRYVQPLVAASGTVRKQCGESCEVVLLGSVATGKYVECLLPVFGERLLFPSDFVGRGDMSRGGLLLRCVAAGTELAYIPVRDAIRRGKRPPKLARL